MYHEQLAIRTKLIPPRPRRRTLHRPRLTARLAEALDYRLTLVHAGAGYGKSTALAALADLNVPLAWYSVADEDQDPLVFTAHLIYAFQHTLAELPQAPLFALERQSDQRDPGAWNTVMDALVNALSEALPGPTLLVLDDYHWVSDVPTIAAIVDRLVSYAPGDLHVILSGRHVPALPGLVVWRARGELLEIDHRDLAFTADEARTLYHSHRLSSTAIESLIQETEGWAIALQLIEQRLHAGAAPDLLAAHLSPGDLFAFLAQEVLQQQPADLQAFMLDTSVLRQMTPAACNALCPGQDSIAYLTHLHERDLFVIDLGDESSRYHRLFHDFLRGRLAPERAAGLHQRAAEHFRLAGDEEAAVYHFLAAAAHLEAATVIEETGEKMVRQGRLDTLAGWIGQLPPDVLDAHPALLTYLGDIARLHSRFDEALGWYAQAEARWRTISDRAGASRALQRQALVYLDTVRPARAENLLKEALRLSEGQQDRHDRARMLELLAENQLNLGHPEEAQRLRAEARQLRQEGPSEDQLSVRVLIRTGQLDRARTLLEQQAASQFSNFPIYQSTHSPPSRSHHSHRETPLLLALVYAFQGQAEAAFQTAQAGIAIGQRLESPFVTAVGYMRLGHAWLIHGAADAHLRAIECYRQAIALGEAMAVQRTRVEAQWGLCRAYGFHGDLAAAEEAAALGVHIGRQAGDPWVVALVELTLGASYVLSGRYAEAADILIRVIGAFRDCSDTFGRAAARLWLALAYLRLGQEERALESADELFHLTEIHGYQHLFAQRALLGPPDNRILVPLLLQARRHRRHASTVEQLLNQMGLSHIEFHPGYRLRVQTLGPFRVWRGMHEVDAREWRRSKALQLFQLLLTHRGRMLQREEIVDTLWPELEPDAVQRNFKVALNAVNKALEPDRPAGEEPAYIARHGSTYGLRPGADLWLDAHEFQQFIETGDQQRDPALAAGAYQRALELYQGEYLQDALYEDWASEERERLLALYLRTAEKLAAVQLEQGRYDDAINLCRRILARDDCWERAYRLMMVAYTRQGNRPHALRVYQTCEETLRRELEIEPGLATRHLHAHIADNKALDHLTI
jgi:DNA-binding SARP family transcriptional activator